MGPLLPQATWAVLGEPPGRRAPWRAGLWTRGGVLARVPRRARCRARRCLRGQVCVAA